MATHNYGLEQDVPMDSSAMTTLFHYTSLPTFLKICESRSIRFCELSKSNDSAEGKFILQSLRSLMQHADVPKHIQACVANILETYLNMYSYYGFCLTSEGDDLGQWRAYADEGQGVAIGFNIENLVDCAKKSPLGASTKVTQIEYGKEAILPYTRALFDVMIKVEDENTKSFWSNPEDMILSKDAAAKELTHAVEIFSRNCYDIKNPSFLMERETRITQETVFTASRFLKFFSRQGRIVPYYDVAINPDCIDIVVSGPMLDVSPHDISRVLSSWSGDLAKIKVYKSISSARK